MKMGNLDGKDKLIVGLLAVIILLLIAMLALVAFDRFSEDASISTERAALIF